MEDHATWIGEKIRHYAENAEEATRRLGTDIVSDREKLALACRIMAHRSAATGLAGQPTARDSEEEQTFWAQTYGLAVEEAPPDNLLRVDHQIEVVEGEGMANPANRFRPWIYPERSNVGSIVRTHPPYGLPPQHAR